MYLVLKISTKELKILQTYNSFLYEYFDFDNQLLQKFEVKSNFRS